MLQLFSAGVISLWLETVGIPATKLDSVAASNALLLSHQEPVTEAAVRQYLKQLSQRGSIQTNQGIWIQSDYTLLANHQGTTPLPAASLTKVATSLVSLKAWGPNYQFVTQVGATGPVQNGVLQGDLIIQGVGDPLFIWEEAISLGNALNTIGINRVQGDLVVVGRFAMNYESNPTMAGNLLREGLNSKAWSGEAKTQFGTLPPGTPQPQVVIDGAVRVATTPPKQTPLIRHRSLPLAQLLRQMNIYSNNKMADMFATSLGGANVVAQQAAMAAGVPQVEIQLINGSGLGQENQISPRAACGLFQAIQRYLQPYDLTVADVFPVAGRDVGTLQARHIPTSAIIKTGTLWDVSTLAGAIPTRNHGPVWFAIMNQGSNVTDFRVQQDVLLQKLLQHWGSAQSLPLELRVSPSADQIGDRARNEILLNQETSPSS